MSVTNVWGSQLLNLYCSFVNETGNPLCKFLTLLIFQTKHALSLPMSDCDLIKGTDCYWSCFCFLTGRDLALLTSPMCSSQEIIAKSSKADDYWLPGDHGQQIWCCFSHLNGKQWRGIIESSHWWILEFGVVMQTNNESLIMFH